MYASCRPKEALRVSAKRRVEPGTSKSYARERRDYDKNLARERRRAKKDPNRKKREPSGFADSHTPTLQQ